MKSLIKIFLVITMVCITFNSYGQFKLDLKKKVEAVQNGIKGDINKNNKPAQNQQVQKDGKTSSTDTTSTKNIKEEDL